MRQSFILLAFAFTFLINSAYSHTNNGHANCAHNKFNIVPEILEVEEEDNNSGRLLQTATYPKIRINADYTHLNLKTGTTEFKQYVINDLLPPVMEYFEAALAVKKPLTSNLRLSSTSKTICGMSTPQALFNGVATDLFLIVSSDEDTDNWVASAGACYLSSTTKRPIIAQMLFNTLYTKAAAGDVLAHEKNMYLTMHEMTHALGFAGSSFKNFIDASGETLTGHIKTVLVSGKAWTVLDVEPLTSRLRKHYGCSTLPGAFMENEGGAGTEGSHFERRHFLYEMMTSGVIHARRISEFSLALLEGSGWYQPNYTYAEPFYFGKGQGCNFLYQNCSSSSFSFEEFCSEDTATRSCNAVGRGGGVCTSDSRTDGCVYVYPVLEYDCENDEAIEDARLPNHEVYGRAAGSRCFEGNLTTLSKNTKTSFCFKYNCVGTGLTTAVEVMVGTTKIVCKAEGKVKVTGLNGLLDCPDPISYCATVGTKYCQRNCMGRGTCVSGQCKCKTGYTGVDCALRVGSSFA